ncbi:MAG: DUF4236 domain-containing protein [Deltaproteobacteria bacterium]|nr:DUF4236 domain-containing protein [Deltaproteobacteria bacterium]
MGFRFRRSIKLIPGVRLNVSTRGASMSVGGRGATLSFSGRGARATFGIPGTGLSWSESLSAPRQRRARSAPSGPTFAIDTIEDLKDAVLDPNTSVVYRGSGRRLSPQQVESARRRLQDKKRREQASAHLAAAEGMQRDILNAWRNTADLPTAEEYEDACAVRRFDFDEEPPTPPHYGTEEGRLEDEIRAGTRATTKHPTSAYAAIAGVPVAIAASSFGAVSFATANSTVSVFAAGALALVAALVTKSICDRMLAARVDQLVKQALPERWAMRKAELDGAHAARCSEHEHRRLAAERQWNQDEEQRAAWARRLVDGDLEALEEAVADTAGDLDFPFEAKCDVAISDDRTVYLHVDLPEIEDVIPETRGQVLKDGRVKQVKRTATERNADYAHLVAGLALFLANEVFIVSPVLHTVLIAAYTQRKKRGSEATVDAYVYNVAIKRERFATIDFADVEPVAALLSSDAAVGQKANMELKALPRPDWTREFDAPAGAA